MFSMHCTGRERRQGRGGVAGLGSGGRFKISRRRMGGRKTTQRGLSHCLAAEWPRSRGHDISKRFNSLPAAGDEVAYL